MPFYRSIFSSSFFRPVILHQATRGLSETGCISADTNWHFSWALSAQDQKVNCSRLCQVVSLAESSDPWNESSCRHPNEWKDADSLSSQGFLDFFCAFTHKLWPCFADLCMCMSMQWSEVNIWIPLTFFLLTYYSVFFASLIWDLF